MVVQRLKLLIYKINFFIYLNRLFKFINLVYLKYLPPPPYFSLGIKFIARSRERGMTLVEVVLSALFLIAAAIGTVYFFAQTKVTMSSSSQSMECQTVAKQALEKVVSLGSRLYGYQIKNNNHQLQYNPLFVKANGGTIQDIGDGSGLYFPPEMYRQLYQNLLETQPSFVNPEENTGVSIIASNTNPIEIAPSVMLINSINGLQYLYNIDPEYFKGNPDPDNSNEPMGKDWIIDSSVSSGQISSLWRKYKDKFGLEDVKFYVRIAPVDLKNGNEILKTQAEIDAVDGTDGICKKARYNGSDFVVSSYPCPTHTSDSNHKLILTRPRLINPSDINLRNYITPHLTIIGNDDLGFEIKVLLKYKINDQDYSCDAMHTFIHSSKTFTGNMARNVSVTVSLLENGQRDNLLDPARKETSYDTDGSGYNNITMELDFNSFDRANKLIGNMFFCQGVSACRSGDDNSNNDSSFVPSVRTIWIEIRN